MKRIVNVLSAIILAVVIIFTSVPMPVRAEFLDLKRSGVNYNLRPGNWAIVYTKLPGSGKYQKVFAKITKYKRSTGGSGNTGGSSSGGSGNSGGITVTLTIQVQLPRALNKKIAKKLQARRAKGLEGDDFIDYVDVVFVDQLTGENLKTSVTDGAEGDNYKEATVKETEWLPYKPQKVSWNGGSYTYHISYAKSLTITFPVGYKRACVGICGNHVKSYDKIQEWNQGFTDGYTVLSDTTHVKLGNRKTTARLTHIFRVK